MKTLFAVFALVFCFAIVLAYGLPNMAEATVPANKNTKVLVPVKVATSKIKSTKSIMRLTES